MKVTDAFGRDVGLGDTVAYYRATDHKMVRGMVWRLQLRWSCLGRSVSVQVRPVLSEDEEARPKPGTNEWFARRDWSRARRAVSLEPELFVVLSGGDQE